MMSMHDMFYANVEPVWVVKPSSEKDKKEEEKKKQTAKKDGKEEYSILNLIPNYPYFYPPYNPPAPAKANDKKETKVTLKVSICCTECEDRITVALMELPGVKKVECNIRKEKVVVTCATAAPADVLLESRRLFRNARLWIEDVD